MLSNSVSRIYRYSVLLSNDAMKDIDEIRRDNMLLIEEGAGSPTAAAKKCDMSLAQWSNLRDGVKDSKTGKRRGMRKETANKIAEKAGYPSGWLDISHPKRELKAESPAGPTYIVPKTRRATEIQEINVLLQRTDDRGLAILLDKARDVAREYPLAKQTQPSSK